MVELLATPEARASLPQCRGTMVTYRLTVKHADGLHLRPIADFVKVASRFRSDICLIREHRRANGKSALELLLLGATRGTELTLEASGDDAPAALRALLEVLTRGDL